MANSGPLAVAITSVQDTSQRSIYRIIAASERTELLHPHPPTHNHSWRGKKEEMQSIHTFGVRQQRHRQAGAEEPDRGEDLANVERCRTGLLAEVRRRNAAHCGEDGAAELWHHQEEPRFLRREPELFVEI